MSGVAIIKGTTRVDMIYRIKIERSSNNGLLPSSSLRSKVSDHSYYRLFRGNNLSKKSGIVRMGAIERSQGVGPVVVSNPLLAIWNHDKVVDFDIVQTYAGHHFLYVDSVFCRNTLDQRDQRGSIPKISEVRHHGRRFPDPQQ